MSRDLMDDPAFADEETLDILPFTGAHSRTAGHRCRSIHLGYVHHAPELEAIFHGEKSIDEALKAMTDRTNEMIARLRAGNSA